MATQNPVPGKKYFTPAQANAMLPLVRRIVQDITQVAADLRARHERISRLRPAHERELDDARRAELAEAEEEFESEQAKLRDYDNELRRLGIELKDYFTGLVDFPCWMDGREVYLCWRLGEPEVAHWHELDAGFAGRQKLMAEAPAG
jgi:hypothetical protein